MTTRNLGLIAVLAGALVLGGCNGSSNQGTASTGSGGTTPSGEKFTIAIVFDSGGRGDMSFNDSAWRGIERAQKEFNLEIKQVESENVKDFETNQTAMAEAGADLVIAVGINQQKALETVAPKFPDTKFAIVDAPVDAPNVRSLVFTEHEGSFLAGYLAGLTTKSNKLGFVGGQQIGLIKKFEVGYAAGAKTANPNVQILGAKYTGSWDDQDKGKASAEILFREGADIVYHAAGRAGLGVIKAAKEQNKYAIGVDSDQDHLAEGNVLTSMVKRVDEAVYQTIKDLVGGSFSSGTKVYDLKSNGVSLSEMKFTKDKIGQETLDKVAAMSQRITSGEVKVPSDEATYQEFLKNPVK